jgi:hypothetical protein
MPCSPVRSLTFRRNIVSSGDDVVEREILHIVSFVPARFGSCDPPLECAWHCHCVSLLSRSVINHKKHTNFIVDPDSLRQKPQ